MSISDQIQRRDMLCHVMQCRLLRAVYWVHLNRQCYPSRQYLLSVPQHFQVHHQNQPHPDPIWTRNLKKVDDEARVIFWRSLLESVRLSPNAALHLRTLHFGGVENWSIRYCMHSAPGYIRMWRTEMTLSQLLCRDAEHELAANKVSGLGIRERYKVM